MTEKFSNVEYKDCDYEQCDRKAMSRKAKWCRGHNKQNWKGQELRPLRERIRKYDPICSHPGCEAPHLAKGYCTVHADRARLGYNMDADIRGMAKANRWQDGYKICPGCGERKHEDDYPKNSSQASGFHQYCRECVRWRNIKLKYNLTREEWIAIFEMQGSSCAACGSEDPGSALGWMTDHDHSCCPGEKSCGKCVCGILCHRCNTVADIKNEQHFISYRKRAHALGIPLKVIATRRFELTA